MLFVCILGETYGLTTTADVQYIDILVCQNVLALFTERDYSFIYIGYKMSDSQTAFGLLFGRGDILFCGIVLGKEGCSELR